MNRGMIACVAVVAVLCSASTLFALPTDDFNDNSQAATWTKLEDNSAKSSVAETGGVLKWTASGTSTSNDDALYMSNGAAGFALSTASDFQFRIDYNLGAVSQHAPGGTDFAGVLDLGLGIDVTGHDSLSIGYGIGGISGLGSFTGLFAAYRVANAQTILTPTAAGGASGTLYVSYDSANDTIYLSDLGYGALNGKFTIDDIVQTVWGASQLLVAFGGRTKYVSTDDANSYLDNFVVDQGAAVAVPEPATLGLLVVGLLTGGLLRRRRIG
ncbi:MAG: hypothetical protein BIFFINMI_02736 [Phycisphaerae bacterium]|nr:hypothetical protein [Phycisphaerae bacterium]